MTTNQKIITTVVVAVATIVILYLQPKYVVDNEKLEKADQIMQQSNAGDKSVHSSHLQEDLEPIIYSLKREITSGNSNKVLNFADSLASIYLKIGLLDSAVSLAEYVEGLKIANSHAAVGNLYFKSANFAINKEQSNRLANKAKEYFDRVLEENPDNLEVLTKKALLMVSSENPMQGILLLREVVTKDPDNWEANFNLGLLSIQSGQFERAVERFEKLVALQASNVQANFYLAYSLFELGKFEQAKEIFEKVKTLDNDPTVTETVDDYLKRIEKSIN